MASLIYYRKTSFLTWNGRSYKVAEGPFKDGGEMEIGRYRVEPQKVNPNLLKLAALNMPIPKKPWAIKLIPLFDSDRNDLSIHAERSQKNIEGCIGVNMREAADFWKAWETEPTYRIPGYLTVVEDHETIS